MERYSYVAIDNLIKKDQSLLEGMPSNFSFYVSGNNPQGPIGLLVSEHTHTVILGVGSYTRVAYSSWGLTMALYAFSLSEVFCVLRCLLRKPSDLFAVLKFC